MYEILNKINGPEDVKKLDEEELDKLASDIRDALFNRITKHGGHLASNFGAVELEIALHYVFNSPVDKFVFDISHQSYTHKMLTGRRLMYTDESQFDKDSGYTNPDESVHDFFHVGHTSTSISLATGLAIGRDLSGNHENIIAIIGDGSLSGGEAMEALNYAGSELKSNLIIIVNDNEQSIAEVHGGIYKNLAELRKTQGKSSRNYFKDIGLDYMYVDDGNNVHKVINALKKVKDIDHPIVVHIHTIKGKGYNLAEENKEQWHWTNPFNKETGNPIISSGNNENYNNITSKYLLEKTKNDKRVIVITPAMPRSAGLKKEIREEMGKQYSDVGIAEEQAIGMASGIAKNGGKPVVISNATFFQRAYDQMSQDVALNDNPITVIMNSSSIYRVTDATHLGIYIKSAFSTIPNVRILAPTNKDEYIKMLDFSIDKSKHPTVILMPMNGVIDDGRKSDLDYSEIKFKVEQKGEKVAIIALGDFYQRGEKIAKQIENELKFKPTLINPRFASDIDVDLLNSLKENHNIIVTIEDGILVGGLGEQIASFYGKDNMKVLNYGLEKTFYEKYEPEELLDTLGISGKKIIEELKNIIMGK